MITVTLSLACKSTNTIGQMHIMENNATTFKQIHVKVQFLYIYIYIYINPHALYITYTDHALPTKCCRITECNENIKPLWFQITEDKCSWCHNHWVTHIIKNELLHIFAITRSFHLELICSVHWHQLYSITKIPLQHSCGISAYPFPLWWFWECVYFILLSSSNRKYDPFAIS